MHNEIKWRSERIDEDHGEIRWEAHGPRNSFVCFEGENAKVDCKIFMGAIAAETKLQKLLEMVAKSDNGVCALIAAEKENLCKQEGEYDTELVKRVAKAYNTAILAWARKENIL